ncbi:bifunctional homocysteine S-methyltransferase/methylenetetrahydrofolate reductase [Gorillibacterium timonense]|uniref:bifunctional homocysteine S-methyltransferase/methylenetetrahydrofolate reductase n=1 Tax=Gorillibacterium timonense TaxID=1689269 RepID=UPI00071E36BC|nr:bifunctional homocysteine S-methyltransferase/methylenetetrahydrofolate reductase [Gorillibacterium timonense]
MKPDLRTALHNGALVGDGAMGTYLYQMGFPVGIPYEEFNLIRPDVIMDIHRQYYEAGARVIETNTFSANREKLAKFGLEEETAAINREGVLLARKAVGEDAYVVGAVGSLRGGRRRRISDETIQQAFTEQIGALLEAGADGILLETFYELSEMLAAVRTVRKLSDTVLICQFATDGSGTTQDGIPFPTAFRQLQEEGADIIGFNCHSGPDGIRRAIEKLDSLPELPLSVYPNAGLPGIEEGKVTYRAEPDYFADKVPGFMERGVRLIGGCCGTTPEHVAAITQALRSYAEAGWVADPPAVQVTQPASNQVPAEKRPVYSARAVTPVAPVEPSLIDLVKRRHTVIVELDSPRDLSIDRYMKASAELRDAGVDALTMADNSLAMTRVSNLSVGHLVKDKLGVRPLLHVACRDRNAIGTQSHLMGMHAMGIRHVLAVTGDPARVGDLPDASSVFDMNSLDLIRMMRQLNEGVAYSGKPLKEKASFVIGAALDPNVKYLDKAIQRMEKKIEAGAHFFMTQPVYDPEKIEKLYEATRHLDAPVFIGIMPLMSERNAEFLHHEVPGIRIPENIRNRMKGLSGAEGRAAGVEIARELADTAVRYFNGIYLMTPMLFSDMTAELTRHIREQAAQLR